MTAVTTLEIPGPVNDFGQLLAHVEELLERVRQTAERILADGAHWLRVMGPLMAELERLCAEFGQRVQDVVQQLRAMLERPGDPVALWLTGNRWLTEVGAPVTARAGTFTADFLHGDNRWGGPAADAYLQTLPPQQEALRSTGRIADATASSLHTMARAICVFWGTVALALATLVVQLTVASGATASPLTAPAGLAGGGAAALEFLAIAGVIVGALGNEAMAALDAQRDLTAQLSDNAAFPGGHWPVSATAAVADGSMTDGDGSDWSLRYQ